MSSYWRMQSGWNGAWQSDAGHSKVSSSRFIIFWHTHMGFSSGSSCPLVSCSEPGLFLMKRWRKKKLSELLQGSGSDWLDVDSSRRLSRSAIVGNFALNSCQRRTKTYFTMLAWNSLHFSSVLINSYLEWYGLRSLESISSGSTYESKKTTES